LRDYCLGPRIKFVVHTVDLTQLQGIVGKYVDKYQLLSAGGPLAATSLTKAFVTSNKAVNVAVGASGAWFAVKELSGPMLNLIHSQFGYLESLFGMFRG
jgi:hypothetical protein